MSVLVRSNNKVFPKQNHYDCLEVDEFWTFVGAKNNKVWLIYADNRETGEIVAYVWGKRNTNTAKMLRKKLDELNISFHTVYSDAWESFLNAFGNDNLIAGRTHTIGIEGNNCRLRHRIRRAFRKICCFSKKTLIISKRLTWLFLY